MKYHIPPSKPKLIIIEHSDEDEWGKDEDWTEPSFSHNDIDVTYITLDHQKLRFSKEYCLKMAEIVPMKSAAWFDIQQILEEHEAGWCDDDCDT